MGNCLVNVDCHDRKDIEVFNKIFLSKRSISELFTVFNEVDVDGSGTISVVEFLVTYRLDSTPLIDLILGSFNMTNLNFLEFSCLLWNFLSMDEARLPAYMFFIFNTSKKKYIPFHTLSKHYHSVHGNFKGNVKLIQPLHAIESEFGDTGVDSAGFLKMCAKYPSISHPLILVQFNFRDKILGLNFWHPLCLNRQRHDAPHLIDPRFVYDEVAARRQENEIMSAELARREGAPKGLARRMSVAITGKKGGAGKGKKQKHSVREKETKIRSAARRLSTTLLSPGQGSQVRTVVSPKSKSSGSGKKKGGVHAVGEDKKYGFEDGKEEDKNGGASDCGGAGNEKQLKALKSSDSIGEKKGSSSKKHNKSKQVHPTQYDDIMDEDEQRDKPPKSSKGSGKRNNKSGSGNVSGAVRRMSTTILGAVKVKSGKKKDRSQQYATN